MYPQSHFIMSQVLVNTTCITYFDVQRIKFCARARVCVQIVRTKNGMCVELQSVVCTFKCIKIYFKCNAVPTN